MRLSKPNKDSQYIFDLLPNRENYRLLKTKDTQYENLRECDVDLCDEFLVKEMNENTKEDKLYRVGLSINNEEATLLFFSDSH